MPELGFGKKSDFDLKIASLGPLLVRFLVEIWSDHSQILKFLGLIFCLAALLCSASSTPKLEEEKLIQSRYAKQ
jgi:hypothetical protein